MISTTSAMQLLTFCLLVTVGRFVAGAPHQMQLMLDEMRVDVLRLNTTVQHSSLTFSTPRTEDIKECCFGQALQCFSDKLPQLTCSGKGITIRHHLFKRMRKNTLQERINSCSEEDKKAAACQPCDSYPQRDSREFIRALVTLLQRSFDRLNHRS